MQESLSVAHRTGAIDTKDLERVAIDTTVQEKAIASRQKVPIDLPHTQLLELLFRKYSCPLSFAQAGLK